MNENLLLYLQEQNKLSKQLFYNGLDIELPRYVKNTLNARYMRVSRVKDRFHYLICRRKYAYFLTFTFDNNYIYKCDRTKRDLIKNCLNSIDDSLYILNIDYGDRTEREHYHCILGTDVLLSKTFFLLTYPCFTWVEQIPLDMTQIKKVSKYINKLSNHSIKDSTKSHRIVYNFKGYDDIKDKPYRNLVRFNDIRLIYNSSVGSSSS